MSSILDIDSQNLLVNGILHEADMIKRHVYITLEECAKPSVIYRPDLTFDGSMWCAIYGRNLQNGVAGFGVSPEEAMWDFNIQWYKKSSK